MTSGDCKRTALIAFLAAILIVTTAAARDWVRDPAQPDPCDGRSDCELGCPSGGCDGYGTRSGWASEIQTTFTLPMPAHGGPWLVEYVAFYLSGSGPHRVIFRDATSGTPGNIIDDSIEFAPADASWPPEGWTFIALRPGMPCPEHLRGVAGTRVTVGTELAPGDAIGLMYSGESERAWCFYDGDWIDDTPFGPAIRLGLSDLGCSEAQQATWGRVKGLFK